MLRLDVFLKPTLMAVVQKTSPKMRSWSSPRVKDETGHGVVPHILFSVAVISVHNIDSDSRGNNQKHIAL